MRHLRQRPLALALILALLVTAAIAAGCGGGQADGTVALPVLHDLAPVADATSTSDSARFEMQYEMEITGLGAPFAFSVSGAYDTPAQKARFTMDFGSFADFMGGLAGSLGGDAPSELTDASKWKLEMLVDGTVAYMRLPLLASELPSGKEWVRVDFKETARLHGVDLTELQSLAKGSDPRQVLDYLRSLSGEVTLVGTEELRGVETSHYFAVVDWQKALASAAREANQSGLFDQLQGLGGSIQNIPVDVWVDKDNLLRRMTMDFAVSSPGGAEQAKASITMELFDYGQPVTVSPPPAADVVDALSLRG